MPTHLEEPMIRRLVAVLSAAAALALPAVLSAAPATTAMHFHSGPSQHVAAMHYHTGPGTP
jgi:hypothetical protein